MDKELILMEFSLMFNESAHYVRDTQIHDFRVPGTSLWRTA
jgi:hypothetical protein